MQNSYPKKYVVLGPGHGKCAGIVKTVPLAEHISSPLVDFKDGVARISTQEIKQKTGSMFIEDLYAEEGTPDHLEAFMKHREAIASGRVVKPFPDSLLPKKSLHWRATAGRSNEPFDAAAFVEAKNPAPVPAPELEPPAPTLPPGLTPAPASFVGEPAVGRAEKAKPDPKKVG